MMLSFSVKYLVKSLGLFVIFFLMSGICFAMDVTLTWDANSDATYYIVYWGENSGNYTQQSEHILKGTNTYTAVNLENKKWYFAVKAFNEFGNSSDFSEEVSNDNSGPDKLPVANAGNDQTVYEGNLVTLDGSGSVDQTGNITKYTWVKNSGPEITINNSDKSIATFQAPSVDATVNINLTLTIESDSGQKASDSCTIIIKDQPKNSPSADAGENINAVSGETIVLDGTGSSDSDGSIISYIWKQTGGPDVNLVNQESSKANFNAPSVDSTTELVFSLSIKDNDDLSASDECTVTIVPDNTSKLPPIANAGSLKSFVSGNTGSLDGSLSSDPDGQIIAWKWVQTSGSEVELSGNDTSTPEFTVPEVSIKGESLTFTLTVTDDSGLSNSDSCEVVVSKSENVFTASMNNPDAPHSLVAEVGEKPSIEVVDKDFNHYEWLKTGWNEYNTLNGEARVVSGDIDGDGLDEVIIGLGPVDSHSDIPGGYFEVLDDDYSHLAWGKVNWDDYNSTNGETWPACGDLDGDGKDEIIVGLGIGGEGALEIFKFSDNSLTHTEWIITDWEDYNLSVGEARPVCGDIDDDGKDEIIVGLGKTANALPEAQSSYAEIIDDNLEHSAWITCGWDEYNKKNGETWPACGDIYGNGVYIIALGFGAGGDGRIEILDYSDNTAEHLDWLKIEWDEYNELSGEARPVFGDIDNDVMDEIIVGLGPFSTEPEIPGGIFQVFDDDFTLLKSAKIMWSEFNDINGETRPMRSSVKNNGKILIGLGKNDSAVPGYAGISKSNNVPGSEAKASSSSCFIISLF